MANSCFLFWQVETNAVPLKTDLSRIDIKISEQLILKSK